MKIFRHLIQKNSLFIVAILIGKKKKKKILDWQWASFIHSIIQHSFTNRSYKCVHRFRIHYNKSIIYTIIHYNKPLSEKYILYAFKPLVMFTNDRRFSTHILILLNTIIWHRFKLKSFPLVLSFILCSKLSVLSNFVAVSGKSFALYR